VEGGDSEEAGSTKSRSESLTKSTITVDEKQQE
jgi:hypothetical protein